jgi:hypothetical protein
MKRIWAGICKYWEMLALVCIVLIVLIIGLTIQELHSAGISAKDINLWNKRVELSAEEDSTLKMELRRLRENEVIIIYTHENERAKIFKISDDSLQYWADSLYNGRAN